MADLLFRKHHAKVRTLQRGMVAFGIRQARRHPYLMAFVGFASGCLSFLLAQRQEEASRIIAIAMLATWVWLMFEAPIRQLLASWLRIKLPPLAVKFGTQILHQESLFFAIPFFVITTTWGSPQMVFTLLLITAAVASIYDPFYYKRIAGSPWLLPLYHSFAVFALLLTALPIVVSMTTGQSYLVALVIAGLMSLPIIKQTITVYGRPWWAWPGRAAILLTIGAAGYGLQSWVPPAALWATDIAITQELDAKQRVHGEPLAFIAESDLHAEGLYAFTAIRAPLGLREVIYHEWRHNGELVDRIALTIDGGRKAGYRSWSHKLNFPADSLGRWDLKLVTSGNQMIARRTFEVTESPALREILTGD